MKTLIAAVALLALCLGAASAEPGAKDIVVTSAWLRATPKGAPVAGGYATITNTGTMPDTLVSAALATAPNGEVHTMTMENGVMHMRRLEAGLTIAPGATVTLNPGGNHLMFPNPSAPIKEGATVTGTLTFKAAGTIPVTFAVAGMAAKTAPGTAAPAKTAPDKTAPGTTAAGDHGAMKGMDHGAMTMDGMDMK